MVQVETNGDPKAATLAVAAMEARATAVVATNHRAAMEDPAVEDMEAVVVTVMTTAVQAEVAAMAEDTMLEAVLVVVLAPIGEVATRNLAPVEVVATAVAMVAAAAATTIIRRALLMEVVPNHHLTLVDLNLVVPKLHQVAPRSSSAILTSQSMKIL